MIEKMREELASTQIKEFLNKMSQMGFDYEKTITLLEKLGKENQKWVQFWNVKIYPKNMAANRHSTIYSFLRSWQNYRSSWAKWQWKDYFNQVNQRITCSNRRKTFYQWKYPWSRIEKNRLLSPRAYLLRWNPESFRSNYIIWGLLWRLRQKPGNFHVRKVKHWFKCPNQNPFKRNKRKSTANPCHEPPR